MDRFVFCALLPGVAAAVILTSVAPAHAGAYAAADFDIGVPLYTTDAAYGLGIGGRLGWRFDLGPAWIAPEVGGHYLAFQAGKDGEYLGSSSSQDHAARLLGGARFGLGGRVQPSFYGHLGAGWLDARSAGPAFDMGFALDLALVPHFTFGAQAGYDVVAIWHGADPSFSSTPPYVVRWLDVGLHAGVAF